MKKGNKRNIAILIIIVTVIWGVVLINIISFVRFNTKSEKVTFKNNDRDSVKVINHSQKLEETKYTYLQRNPFELPIRKVHHHKINHTKTLIKKPVSQIIHLNYKISGTIVNDTDRMLVLEDFTNKKTVFLKEGDVYEGIKIDSILTEHVTLTENHVKRKIQIPR